MFLNNKYASWYWSLINRAKSRSLPHHIYKERHHIIPRCMGGSNQSVNLVNLTAKEHYIAHLLLPHMVIGRDKYKLQVAFWRMCSPKDGRHIPCNRMYEQAKLQMAHALSELKSGIPLPLAQRIAMKGRPAPNKGKKMSYEHGIKISEYRTGKQCDQVTASKISDKLTDYYSHNPEASKKGKPCPKFMWVLHNRITNESCNTTNLKLWCQSQPFSDATFYKGRTDWIIVEKYKLSDNSRII